VIRFPRNHLADETVARINIAAKRARTRHAAGPELEPDDAELVDLPAELMPSSPPALGKPAAETPIATETVAEEVPPLEDSGLDTGLMLGGADSFDALLKT
jgi:hypothetical protein